MCGRGHPYRREADLLEKIVRDASRAAREIGVSTIRMISSGTLAVTVPPERVEDVSTALEELGAPFAFVGRVTEGGGVHILGDGKARHYVEICCEEDELARMWTLYPCDG